MIAHVFRRSDRENASRVLNEEAVAVFGFFKEMRRHDDGRAVCGEPRNAAPKGAPTREVRARSRFVEEENFRSVKKRAGDREIALRAFGERCGEARAAPVEPVFGERRFDRVSPRLARDPVAPGKVAKILLDRQFPVEREALSDVADPASNARECAAQIKPVDFDRALEGGNRPQSIRKVVVFPAPSGPISAVTVRPLEPRKRFTSPEAASTGGGVRRSVETDMTELPFRAEPRRRLPARAQSRPSRADRGESGFQDPSR